MERELTHDYIMNKKDWTKFEDDEVFMARWLYYEYGCRISAIREVLKLDYLSQELLTQAIKGRSPQYTHIKDYIDEELKEKENKDWRRRHGIKATREAYSEIIKGGELL